MNIVNVFAPEGHVNVLFKNENGAQVAEANYVASDKTQSGVGKNASALKNTINVKGQLTHVDVPSGALDSVGILFFVAAFCLCAGSFFYWLQIIHALHLTHRSMRKFHIYKQRETNISSYCVCGAFLITVLVMNT